MLSALIGLLIVQVIAKQQTPIYLTPFVTSRHYPWQRVQQVDDYDESDISNVPELIDRTNILSDITRPRPDFEEYYKLRFQPVEPMPRIFWHKFKRQKNVTTTEMPEETTTVIVTTTTETEITTIPPRPSSSTTPPTVRPPTPPVIFTTPNTIMRPPNKFVPGFTKDILLFGSPLKVNLLQKRPNAPKAKGKGFLGLFEVIQFNNTKCSVDMGDVRTMEGICYHEFECKNIGGIPTKSCGEGAGVCCIFLTSCGDSTDQSIVYFESPNYPNPVNEMMICVLIVNLRPNIAQLRLDFLMFELNRPTNGDCVDDQFIVSGQNMNYAVPILCGINTGQHIYLHVGNSFEKKIYISFFAKVPKGGRSFNIKISQLKDDLAPTNCLQYFTDQEGIVKSFNYDIDGAVVDNKEATYLNNLNYAICIERSKETCSVIYYTEHGNGEVPSFQIINKDDDEADLVPDGQAGAGIFNCPDDYIAINSVRLCGERFNDGTDNEDFTMHAPVRDIAAGPIILPVRTDSEYVGHGFNLHFKQELCV